MAINIPKNFNPKFPTKDFRDLVDFFNKLEEKLQYPNCEGYADAERILNAAIKELILWGKI